MGKKVDYPFFHALFLILRRLDWIGRREFHGKAPWIRFKGALVMKDNNAKEQGILSGDLSVKFGDVR